MLVKAGLIDETQLTSALAWQRQWGGRLGEIIVEHGFLDEAMLWLGLSRQLGVPLVSLPGMRLSDAPLSLIPIDTCERLEVFPLSREEKTLTLATSDPSNVAALDEVSFRTGLQVKAVLAPHREVLWAIRCYCRGEQTACPPPRQRRPTTGAALELAASPDLASAPLPVATRAPQMLVEPDAHEQLRQANETLRVVIDLCVERGVFTRDELRTRITSKRSD